MGFINVLLPKTSCAELQLKKKKILLDRVHICFYGSMCTHDNCCLQRLEEVDVLVSYLMWVPETEDRSSTRAEFPLNY